MYRHDYDEPDDQPHPVTWTLLGSFLGEYAVLEDSG